MVSNAQPREAPIYPEVKEDFHEITQAASAEAAQQAYDRFIRTWEKKLPKVVKSLREAGEELLLLGVT